MNAHLRFQLKFFFTATTFFLLIGSQAMPTSMPPPRKLPQRSWAASIPTILTHSALNVLLLPSPTPGLVPGLAGSYLCSPLERFLGSVIMRRHLQRIIQQETVWFRMFQYWFANSTLEVFILVLLYSTSPIRHKLKHFKYHKHLLLNLFCYTSERSHLKYQHLEKVYSSLSFPCKQELENLFGQVKYSNWHNNRTMIFGCFGFHKFSMPTVS